MSGTLLATQGGGYATETRSGSVVFVDPPDWGGFEQGQRVPEEWGLVEINKMTDPDREQELRERAAKLY